jgi:hypothetical protein
MKRLTLFALATAGLLALSPVHAATFDDVQYWVGSGPNQAALVIDWNDGKSPESLLWGYRWDGSATGLDMLESVVNADPRLFAHVGTFSWGTAMLGIGYDLNNSGGFAVSPSLTFDGAGLALDSNPNDARVATDSADHYLEGWNNGFWGYYTRASSSGAWASSFVGARDRVLADGAWDAYNFEADFASSIPSDPTPAMVPEPTTVSLFTLSALTFVWLRRRHA